MTDTSANLPKKSAKISPAELDLLTFFEFITNAKENISEKNIANITVLTLMGRLKIKNGYIKVGDIEILKGKQQKKYAIDRELSYGRKKYGEIKLGGEEEKITLSRKDTMFIDSICHLATLLIKNIDNIDRLKNANKKLSKKILQFESIFEASKEMLFTREIEKAVSISMNIISGSLGIKEIAIVIKDKKGERFFTKNIKNEELSKKKLKKIKVNYLTGFLGEKINGKKPEQSEVHFAQIVLNLLYSNIENFKMINQLLEKERLEKEIMIARDIQQKLLPLNIPEIKGIEIKTGMITYHQVGGDYYDVLKIDDKRVLIIIADVSGKGIPASLIMSAVQSSIKTLILKGNYELESIAETLNKLLTATTESNKFVALSLLLIDSEKDTIQYLNAGHTAPLLFSGKEIIKLKEGGPVIGLLDFAQYTKNETKFKKGDCIFMYTDGISEAKKTNGEEIGEKTIIKLVQEGKHIPEFDVFFNNKLLEMTKGTFEDDVTFIFIKKV